MFCEAVKPLKGPGLLWGLCLEPEFSNLPWEALGSREALKALRRAWKALEKRWRVFGVLAFQAGSLLQALRPPGSEVCWQRRPEEGLRGAYLKSCDLTGY